MIALGADFVRCGIRASVSGLLLVICIVGWGSEGVRECEHCVLTERDSGGLWTIALSTSASIRLTNDYLWSAPRIDSDNVELSVIAYESDPGFTEWRLRPRRPGLVSVRFTGELNPPGDQGTRLEAFFEFEVEECKKTVLSKNQ